MAFWMRAATLQIGSQRYDINDLAFAFEISFEDNVKLCKAKVTVYNLASSTRNQIEKGMPIIINAGYRRDTGEIFNGELDTVNHEKQNVDWVTKLEATASLKSWLTSEINKTYRAGSTARDIINDLLNIFGVEVGTVELVQNITYPRGRVCKGKLQAVLQEIVVTDCKSRLLIKNGQIIINNPANGTGEGDYVLSSASGLLRSTVAKEEQGTLTALDTQKSREQREQETASIKCECLLNYRLSAAEQISIRSAKLNGRYIVVRGTHTGNRSGDWKTVVEVKPA
ncbi:MAG: hypothetical protein HFG27_08590 [Provencibacterium sp.]|jgi:hypothetical protein|nr:hypothetical protein [Provencibacterium sp.]